MQGLDRTGKLQMEETISRSRQTWYVKGYFRASGWIIYPHKNGYCNDISGFYITVRCPGLSLRLRD